MDSEQILMIIQLIIMLILFIIILLLLRQNKSIHFERRIGRYSVDNINDNSMSFFDETKEKYLKKVKKIRKTLKKSKFINNYAKKYNKYLTYEITEDVDAIDYVIHKFLIALAFVFLIIFAEVLQLRLISIFEIVLYFIIGFFFLDIYLKYKMKLRLKMIESEILKAVIIMNNAFRSGKSTLQAVYIASNELPEPIASEFKRIYHELHFGLSIDVAFERFAERVNIEEVKYLSSSLTILNKTGGNIVQVFSSIERTLFDKKKLKEELKNLTTSSNLMIKILLFVPFVFVLLIYVLNPNYFDPLFSSPIGIMTLVVMILLFIVYAFFLQKIMKVKV